jgi:hypothetical protein
LVITILFLCNGCYCSNFVVAIADSLKNMGRWLKKFDQRPSFYYLCGRKDELHNIHILQNGEEVIFIIVDYGGCVIGGGW